jgi:hypothetical protein
VLFPKRSGEGTGIPVPSRVTKKSSADSAGAARARQKTHIMVKDLILPYILSGKILVIII